MNEMNAESEENYSHLIPAAKRIAVMTDEDRIRWLGTDWYIGYGRAQEANSKLHWLFHHPKRQRMPNLMIIGPTNNGKSMIIEKFVRSVSADFPSSREQKKKEDAPVVCMHMPPGPSIARFYSMLLSSIGASFSSRGGVVALEHIALTTLEKSGIKLLIIDEVHNLLAGSRAQQREFMNLLRMLGNMLRIPIVCVGTHEAYLAIRSDRQLENRFEPLLLPKWVSGKELDSLLATYGSVLLLREPSKLQSQQMSWEILKLTDGIIGEMFRLLSEAAIVAIKLGKESIDREIFEKCQYRSPDERKRVFARPLM